MIIVMINFLPYHQMYHFLLVLFRFRFGSSPFVRFITILFRFINNLFRFITFLKDSLPSCSNTSPWVSTLLISPVLQVHLPSHHHRHLYIPSSRTFPLHVSNFAMFFIIRFRPLYKTIETTYIHHLNSVLIVWSATPPPVRENTTVIWHLVNPPCNLKSICQFIIFVRCISHKYSIAAPT